VAEGDQEQDDRSIKSNDSDPFDSALSISEDFLIIPAWGIDGMFLYSKRRKYEGD
jgi:hypothetical protein